MTVSSRLRVIQGHLRAVDRLIAESRTSEAIAQLLTVRGSIGAVTALICRHHVLHCLDAEATRGTADLLAWLRAAAAGRAHGRPRSRHAA